MTRNRRPAPDRKRATPHARAMLAGILVLAGLHALPPFAGADTVVDQQQPQVVTDDVFLVIGDFGEQKLAQTVTAGVAGALVEVRLPVNCGTGTLIVEIVALAGDVPGTTVLARAEVAAGELPWLDPPEFRPIALERPVWMEAGQRFAIVVRNETGFCSWPAGPAGDSYPAGELFYDVRPNPPGWLSEGTMDLPFATVVDVPEPGPRRDTTYCQVIGLRPDPGASPGTPVGLPMVPFFLPICRCLEDLALRELRCTLFHPEFFLVRRIPSSIAPGQSFAVRWTLFPLRPLPGTLKVMDRLPSDFEGALKSPLLFDGEQIPPDQTRTIQYDVVAGSGGRFKVDTPISLSVGGETLKGTLRTTLDVGER